MKVKKQTAIILGVAGFVLILAIWFALRGPSGDSRAREQGEMASSKEPGVRIGDDGIPVVEDDPKSVLERYKKWSVYPPHSRPLFAGQVDLLKPYNLERTPVGVIEKPAEGCEKAADGSMKCAKPPVLSEIKCSMEPERYISVGKKDFHVTLRCYNPKQAANLPIDSIETKVYHIPLKEVIPSLPPISGGDDGQNGDEKAGDRIYTFAVRPGSSDWGPMFLEATFTVQGMKQAQRTDWYSTPHIVGEFQQGIRDANRGGHLIVSVPVTIMKDGYYLLEANLVQKGEDQEPIGSAIWEGDLKTGSQVVDFQFWGKVIKDKGKNGPYLVQNIRGFRNNSPVTPGFLKKITLAGDALPNVEHKEPLQEYLEPVASPHTTSAYRAEEFSGDEWRSEEKDRRLKYLQELSQGAP